MGAEVCGYSLPFEEDEIIQKAYQDAKPHFIELGLHESVQNQEGDIRDLKRLASTIRDFRPDFVFHLAAQSLVRRSYEIPVETYDVNVMGTIHVMEALRQLSSPTVAIMVTSDKCYENREWLYGYREEDRLGGHDPYSCSKGMCELAVESYRKSFFGPGSPVKIASVRAGNVIGGGDWSLDRIVPDCMRSLRNNHAIPVRNPGSIRPWQHVLEPLYGYLALAAEIARSSEPKQTAKLCSPFNFGPKQESHQTVLQLVHEILKHWPGSYQDLSDPTAVHEAKLLALCTDKAKHLLHWESQLDFTSTIHMTVDWYKRYSAGESALSLTQSQIEAFSNRIAV
jgi:CDP-glucose 4,6-dehydratase